jgi:hypothetical protein
MYEMKVPEMIETYTESRDVLGKLKAGSIDAKTANAMTAAVGGMLRSNIHDLKRRLATEELIESEAKLVEASKQVAGAPTKTIAAKR